VITLRKSADRGHANHGWLDSYHTFSFADYYDEKEMGFSVLRVINEDSVQPGQGFSTHSHRDMEIVSYVLEGALEHKDSIGTGSVIRPGDVQRMSAGTGIRHSEYNASAKDFVHFLQIWIEPKAKNLPPSYEQEYFPIEQKQGKLKLIVSEDGREGSVHINQDVSIYASVLEPGQKLTHQLVPVRHNYAHLVRGEIKINGVTMKTGDGAKITGEQQLEIIPVKEAELLLFDLP
jgi:redox-sensitive bicupin YhaK (pirin superfamily)